MILFLAIAATNCNNNPSTSSVNGEVKKNVGAFMDSIASNISAKGPKAWLDYFENSKEFFMASDGQIAFANIDSARNFVNNVLAKNISSIQLQWSNIRIDSLAKEYASIAADFHEDISDTDGKISRYDGYFTAIGHLTSSWKLQNVHWSLKPNL